MLTGIVKATRAHYAALQHRAGPDRVPLHYTVYALSGPHQGTVQVPKAARQRRANVTRLLNRLQAMFPESRRIEISYNDGDLS